MKKLIVENPPLLKENGILIPQPTRFWLIDKNLKKEISKLEEKGTIRYISSIISEDKELFEEFLKLHSKEISLRKSFLQKKYPHILKDPYRKNTVNALLRTGIGGIREYNKKPFKVKCLHLWTAYHIGGIKNFIGEWVLKQIKV